MQLARTTIRLCAVLLSLTYMGCGTDNEPGGPSTGGATTTVTGTKATGGRTGTGGTAATTKATGGASNVASTATGGSPITTGGTSAVVTSPVTGGASTVVTTGGASAVATGGAGTTTGGASAVATFAISGTVSGLSGTGLVLAIGTDTLAVTVDGGFTFPKQYASGAAITVAIATQPSGPPQVCTVAGGTIASLTSNVSNVAVTCVTNSYSIGGAVTGLAGTGLVLQNNAGDDLAVAADGAFAFPAKVASGKAYTVSIKTQPSNPVQTCTVSGGSGTVASANVSAVTINCSTDSFTIGGTVEGLDGAGLVLQNNAGDDVPISTNGSFAFATPVKSGNAFVVTVKTQPTEKSQTCVVTSGTGTVAAGAVSTVAVTCTTNTYKVKGTVAGLAGTGLTLQNNLGDNLPVAADGAFAFTTSIASGGLYSVTVLQQPNQPTQECVVTAGAGTVNNAEITNVAVTCTTSTFTVGGTVVGLVGTGLVLQNNAADDFTIDADGAFTFATKVASGAAFAVTVKTAPQGVFCSVAGGIGTVGSGAVNVTVNCSDQAHSVSGTVTGLTGNTGVRLALNGGNVQAVFGNRFAFTDLVAKGGTYEVTVSRQPTIPWQTCTVANGSGTMDTTDISNVEVTCVTNPYAVGGTVSGLAGSGLVLQNNLGDDIPVAANAGQLVAFSFPTAVLSGQSYSATVKTQPSSPMQTCLVTQAAGSVGGAAITNISVTCTTNKYSVSGVVSGLAGTLVLANGLDTKTITNNGEFTFADINSGTGYNIAVQTQPTDPSQTCTVVGGSGTMVDADITGVTVTCTTNSFNVGGTVTGLASDQTIGLKNGTEDLTVSGDGAFHFQTPVLSGQGYAVTITSAPSAQNCSITGDTGTVGGADVTTVMVNCTNKPTVGGTISGLTGSGLELVLTGAHTETISVSSGTTFAFTAPFENGEAYTVSVATQPISPYETCTVTNGSGTVGSASVTDVAISCTPNMYNLSVDVSGLSGTGLVLQNNDGSAVHNLPVAANSVSTFTDKVASGSSYTVSVLTAPTTPSQTCVIASSTGTVAGTDITLLVTCTNTTYTVGGTVAAGYVTGMVLQDNVGDDLSISSTGTFTFATKVASGSPYAVTIKTSPAGTNCAVYNGSGTVTNANITSVFVTCSPPYTFDFNTQGWYTNAAPTGLTLVWASGISSTSSGGSLAVNWPAAPGTGGQGFQIGVSASPVLDLSWATTMTLKVRIDGATPASDGQGQFQLYVQDSVGGWASGATATGWWQVTQTPGTWYTASSPLPASGIDFTKISGFGLNIYVNDQALMQATTIYLDSVTFE